MTGFKILTKKLASMINIPGRFCQSNSSTQSDLMTEPRSLAKELHVDEMYRRCVVGTNGKMCPLQHCNGNYPDNNPAQTL